MTINIHTYTFPNGFRIIYEKSKNKLPVSSIQILCDIGSVYEDSSIRGVSHFIEHMIFKGTKQILYSKDLFEKFDSNGAIFNANTTKQYTRYIVKCQDTYVDELVLVLSDILLNSVFDKKEFEKEMNVVIEENKKDDEEEEYLVENEIDKMVFANTNYSFPVDIMKYHKKGSLKYKNVMDAYRLFYQPNNIVFSIVSNKSFSSILRILKKSYFCSRHLVDNIELNEKRKLKYLPLIVQTKPEYKFLKADTDVSYLSISFRVCSQYSADKYSLNILKRIIAGTFSSRLFLLLREDNGLTYHSSAESQYYEMAGSFIIDAITDENKLIYNGVRKGVLPLIIEVLNDLIKNGVKNRELLLIKNYFKGKNIINMEDSDTLSIYNSEYMLLYSDIRTYVPYDKVYDTFYKNITKEHVHSIIKKYIKKINMNVCVLSKNASINAIKHECEKLIL